MTSDYVLIADDDQARVATCLDVFGTIAADIQVAGTTRDALAFLARRGTPRVLVLNATLPQDGAFAVCDALPSRDRACVPVVLWTASRATRELARVRL
ncbi:MAG TPA: hypothetical protein VG871_23060, partial [Vicinamibacterales bacterium]|nr:hypothetical protein [Vicinamibacterales bacterium]